MILSNVNIGTGPSAGDGDPLRSAFSIINTNFQTITNNVNALTNSVSSVAGRTGNVILTITDIVGLNTAYATQANLTTANTAMKGYVDYNITANIALLVNSAPVLLDTIRELADAIGDDPNFAANVALSVSLANTSMRSYVDGQISAANAGITSANVGLKGYVDLANTIQSGQVGAANLAITSANVGLKGYVDQANTIQSAQISAANIGIKGYIDQGNTIQAAAITAANVGMKGYVDNAVATGGYSNVQVATYLPTYTGNISAGNITVTTVGAYKLGTGATKITSSDNTSVELTPDTGANALAGVKVGGLGYILGPNGARNITLNYGGVSGVVGLQGNVTIGTAASSTLTVNGNITASVIIKTGAFSVSSLPTASSVGAGARSFVTDANTITFNSAVTVGGANNVPVFSDGIVWRVG